MSTTVPDSRYITLQKITPVLQQLAVSDSINLSEIGKSVLGAPIQLLKFGTGAYKILAWSQMHGNETTTTKALLDYFLYLSELAPDSALSQSLSIYAVPILNPDGAEAYTRENANGIDLNRDATTLSQPESQCLRKLFDTLKPDLCLNLHGQRSIYGLNGTERPSILSFLAPAADAQRTVLPARLEAMHYINAICEDLNDEIKGCIGRYDDTYNASCVGDSFTALGCPTILFEAGQFASDYNRNNTRGLLLKAFKRLFEFLSAPDQAPEREDILAAYLELPENLVNHYDIILKQVLPQGDGAFGDIAIQYKEELDQGNIRFIAKVEELGKLSRTNAHSVLKDQYLSNELLRLEEKDYSHFIDKYVAKTYSL